MACAPTFLKPSRLSCCIHSKLRLSFVATSSLICARSVRSASMPPTALQDGSAAAQRVSWHPRVGKDVLQQVPAAEHQFVQKCCTSTSSGRLPGTLLVTTHGSQCACVSRSQQAVLEVAAGSAAGSDQHQLQSLLLQPACRTRLRTQAMVQHALTMPHSSVALRLGPACRRGTSDWGTC